MQRTPLIRSLLLGCLSALCSFAANAATPAVAPGAVFAFQNADSGGTQCRLATGDLPDTVSCSPKTTYNANQQSVRVSFLQKIPLNGLGLGHYSTAWIQNDFSIPGNASNHVDVQISVTFDYFGSLFAAGAYKLKGQLNLNVSDVTPGDAAGLVTSSTLFQQERSGDQGLADISGGTELEYPRGESASIQVKLRRGRTYRITFILESLCEEFIVGEASADCAASWSKLAVAVANDQVGQLDEHDAAIKAALSAHDAAVKSAIAAHDADMKAALAAHDTTMKAALAQHDADIKRKLDSLQGQLTDINAKLAEIKTLLLTPQGRRPGFPNK